MIDEHTLLTISYRCLLDLATEEGINASGKDEIFGCIFGRDSAITILKILKTLNNTHSASYVDLNPLKHISRTALLTLTRLQGKEVNIESGEEPGKFIHEFRKDKYEHLVQQPTPWYLYSDNTLRNYDSLDSTPLALIVMYKYWQTTHDEEFLQSVLPAVESGLNWMLLYGDRDRDELVEYELIKTRTYGGLAVQSWTDSIESILKKNGSMPLYPIAPVEVQGYVWLAYKLWADFYTSRSAENPSYIKLAEDLVIKSANLKRRFNETFIMKSKGLCYPVQALDGRKKQIKTITGNPLLLLWASYTNNGACETILEKSLVHDLVQRAFLPDMFDPDAGIRTMSTHSQTYNPGQDSYHNGSFWPKLNGMAHEGLELWEYHKEAQQLKNASLKPLLYFGSPIELYVKGIDNPYEEYKNQSGQISCRYQAWSAAAALDLLTA